MKKLYLSHSQINTYKDCKRKWYLDKVERIRPNYYGSALLFGSALDSAVEHILLKKEGCYKEALRKSLKNFKVNGIDKELPKDILDIRFFAGDVDAKLLDQNAVDQLCTDVLNIDTVDIDEFLLYCKGMRKKKKPMTEIERKLFNLMAYSSLIDKGLLLIEKLKEWIDDNILEVHSVQKKIEIENDDGDKFIGYLDFVVTLKSGKKVLIDLKTSSNPKLYYPPDSATNSPQLGIYAQEEGLMNVAYLVGDKKIRVREPRVRISFIEGVITEDHLDNVFYEIDECTIEIKENLDLGKGAFEKNLDSCTNFGGCQYFNLCKKGDMKGLCYVKK